MIRKAVHALEGTVMEQLTHDQEARADRMTPQNRWESRFPRTNGRPGQPQPACTILRVAAQWRPERAASGGGAPRAK